MDKQDSTKRMTCAPVERKFRMTRWGWVDVFLHNNEREYVVVGSYQEYGDGSWTDATGKEHRIVGKFWSYGTVEREEFETRAKVQDEEFREWFHGLAEQNRGWRTQREAIQAALEGSS